MDEGNEGTRLHGQRPLKKVSWLLRSRRLAVKELAGAHLEVLQDDGRWVTVQPEATWADLPAPEASI